MGQTEESIEFPVVLYNGDRQISVGNIEIHSTIDFHKFRAMLKQMIGISYNNLTTYLVGSRRPEINSDQRKILITSKADFLALIREKNAYFLVVMKRSRRDRRRKNNNRICAELSPADLFDYGVDCNRITTQAQTSHKVEFWLHELHMQRANNINFMIRNMNCELYMDANAYANANFPSIEEAYPAIERSTSRALCEDCSNAIRRGLKPMFHPCVYDEIVEGFFRTTAGPISRPR